MKNKKKVGRPSFSKRIKEEILKLHNQGLSIREIAWSVRVETDSENDSRFISKSYVGKALKENEQLSI